MPSATAVLRGFPLGKRASRSLCRARGSAVAGGVERHRGTGVRPPRRCQRRGETNLLWEVLWEVSVTPRGRCDCEAIAPQRHSATPGRRSVLALVPPLDLPGVPRALLAGLRSPVRRSPEERATRSPVLDTARDEARGSYRGWQRIRRAVWSGGGRGIAEVGRASPTGWAVSHREEFPVVACFRAQAEPSLGLCDRVAQSAEQRTFNP